MRVIISYPIPCETPEIWQTFRPFVKRFTDAYRQFPPGCEHTLVLVINGPTVTTFSIMLDFMVLFNGLSTELVNYQGGGFDLGSHQHVTMRYRNCFQCCLTTRAYPHKEGWLKKLVEAREAYGPGLYGCTVSKEGRGTPYICTRGWCVDTEDFRNYPVEMDSRDKGVYFECGDGCLTEWFNQHNRPSYAVYWDGVYPHRIDGVYPVEDAHNSVNIFRKSDQSNLLIHDKHTDAYRDADETEKRRLEEMCYGTSKLSA